jgi:hypothetical protein
VIFGSSGREASGGVVVVVVVVRALVIRRASPFPSRFACPLVSALSYSFGIVLWELTARKVPYSEVRGPPTALLTKVVHGSHTLGAF